MPVYKYLVYFDGDGEMYTIDLAKNIKILPLDKQNNDFTLFYFSNKYITGVDAKKYMPDIAHGLVTVSCNTTLRDFAQGIFRMRNILEMKGQSIDIIIQEEIYIKYSDCTREKEREKEKENRGIKNQQKIIKNKLVKTCYQNNNIRLFLFTLLLTNNNKIENKKIKMLIKQNILALGKHNNRTHIQKLYIPPQNQHSMIKKVRDNKDINRIILDNIENNNLLQLDIYNIYKIYNVANETINNLLNIYVIKNTIEVSTCQNKETKKDIELPKRAESQIEMYNLNINHYRSLSDNDRIIIIYDNIKYKTNVFIIYNPNTNILLILDIVYFIMFIGCQTYTTLCNNNNIIISLYTKYTYRFNNTASITEAQLSYIRIIVKLYMQKINKDNLKLLYNEQLIQETDEYIAFNTNFDYHYINSASWKTRGVIIDRLIKKYMKYKNKYLKLKKK
jgi:hypothetical protein